MRRNNPETLLIIFLSFLLCFLSVSQAAGQSEFSPGIVYYNLTEVFRRLESIKEKPRDEIFRKYLWRSDGSLQPELLIFRDPETGREVWRLTHDFSRNTPHCHINRSPWNSDGSRFVFNSDRWFLPGETEYKLSKRMFIMNSDGSGMLNLLPHLDGRPYPELVDLARHVIWDRDDPALVYFVDRAWFYQADTRGGFALEKIGALEPAGRRRVIFSYPSDNDIIMVKDIGSQEYQPRLYFFDMRKSSANYRKMIYSYPFAMGIDDPDHKKSEEWHIHDITFRRNPDDNYVLNYGPFDKVGEYVFFDFPLDGKKDKISLAYARDHGKRPYFSHPAWPAGGGQVAYWGEQERGMGNRGLHVWDYINDSHLMQLADDTEATGGHIAWDGYDKENFFAAPGKGEQNHWAGKIIWAHLDGRKVEVLCNTHTQWQTIPGREHDYCSLARPAQSPDGTKCFFTSTVMQPETGGYDCYLVVAARPAPPVELSATAQDRGVRLEWKPPELSREVRLYRIYRIKGDNYSFNPLAECPAGQQHYLDGTLEAGSVYYYAVTSEEYSGLESDSLSPVIEVRVSPDWKLDIRKTLRTGVNWDNIPPEAPMDLRGTRVAPGQYYLQWQSSLSPDVRYYNVYYSPVSRPPCGQEYLIASLPRGEVSFFDFSAGKNGKAHYAIISVDRQDNLSSPVFYDEP
ncbi:MAG TPA: hypothetical protein VM123_01610 [archaeon]|nr:hypothetical protein [archaeon]